MADISNERLQELVEFYASLKVRVLKIDEKYSVDYVEPSIDLPPSLNLQKLEYVPKTEEELRALAEQAVLALIISKQATIDKTYQTKLKSLNLKLTQVNDNALVKMAELATEYDENCNKIRQRAINHGLVFSTVTNSYLSAETKAYSNRIADVTDVFNNKRNALKQEQSDAEEIYQQSCDALEEEKKARIAQAYQKLLDAEEDERIRIEKYNNSLEEKEQKYQASRERTLELARRAAHSRALENTKLYAQLGETGYRQLIQHEKYIVCQDAFYSLRRNEAQAVLTFDSFLRAHLGIYYDAFVDWINTTLLP